MEDEKQEDKLLQAVHLMERPEHSTPEPDLPVTKNKPITHHTLTTKRLSG